ncbi:bifunctional 4-hydroxy-2-oxoglutarate aldolase/2-dehydro-3-deoxy-phosphogluconate aldolase [Actinomadura atramentaria]|uniref:bifunctional 4-hydroxy-2-oxoglutarate aldolase/2-dehydro-3-deoxy-phosphogluconate aldolase n=1 Tax=Actinomadura atramentaria TaxID=1990 RepID=UPI00037E2437|nr:bifunctional 4-hydroxy-2-oxoglutarate aldolase/2-dehydro-3-deoxy-phosphogluconate aldolase [Actinomadura atramentaria]
MTPRLTPGAVLAETGVVAVVRGTRGDRTAAVLDTLVRAGVRCLEVTLNTPGALDAIRAAADRLPALADGPIEVGAGTVRTAADATAAVRAGATFLVAPGTGAEVAAAARDLGVAHYPGALTPTEVETAWNLGATAVKLFPARALGPGYLRDLREPFRDVPFVPTGGVSAATAGEYVAAGAVAVGAGGSLIGDALDGGPLDALADRARALLAAVAAARGTGAA